MNQLLSRTSLLLAFIIIPQPGKSDSVIGTLAYPLPPGGWTYVYNGDQALTNSATSFSCLDGTWDHNNGSDSWDISAPIGGIISSANKPGGIMAITNAGAAIDTNVTYMRMQSPGRPPQYSGLPN